MQTSYQRKLDQIQKVVEAKQKDDQALVKRLSTVLGIRAYKRRGVKRSHDGEVVSSGSSVPSVTKTQRAEMVAEIAAAQTRMSEVEKPLHTFILDCAPFLNEHMTLRSLGMPTQDLTVEFQRYFNCAVSNKLERSSGYPSTCSNCALRKSFVDIRAEASYVCTNCGNTVRYGFAEGPDSLPHEDRIRLPSPPYTYKPLQHFIDLMNQVEGRTTRIVPKEVYMELRLKFREMRIHTTDIVPPKVRQMLRKIKKCKYYEDIYVITKCLNPQFNVISIPQKRKDILKNMFREVYPRFKRNAAKVLRTRKNFLSYPYVAFKFCELCDWTEYMHVFHLLKSREKLRKQDLILQHIFKELNWEWTHTV